MPNPGTRQHFNGATVKNFTCPERPDACVVKLNNGTDAYVMVNDQRMLALLAVAAGTTKTVDVDYIEGKPATPPVHLLVTVSLNP